MEDDFAHGKYQVQYTASMRGNASVGDVIVYRIVHLPRPRHAGAAQSTFRKIGHYSAGCPKQPLSEDVLETLINSNLPKKVKQALGIT